MDKFLKWWMAGHGQRIPNEDTAPWSVLIADDFKQLTHADEAYESGETSWRSWRPLKAFTPRMLATGPSPLIRQLVERPLTWMGGSGPGA